VTPPPLDHPDPTADPTAGPTAGPTEQRVDFAGVDIAYDDRVLEPRAWTVAQSTWVAELGADAPPGPILELCSGAGHMGIVAARESGRALLQVDANPVACDFARRNAATAGVVSDVRCVEMTRATIAPGSFPLVLADPPWVRRADVGRFPEDPVEAIDGGDDGTELAAQCLTVAADALRRGGHLVLQVGDERQLAALERHPRLVAGDLRLEGTRRFERGLLAHYVRG